MGTAIEKNKPNYGKVSKGTLLLVGYRAWSRDFMGISRSFHRTLYAWFDVAQSRLQLASARREDSQITPLEIDGAAGIFINLMRYVGWLGDQGVQLFLVASGFGLALFGTWWLRHLGTPDCCRHDPSPRRRLNC